MKTKDNIQKVVNLNGFICEMSKDYEILTYAESYLGGVSIDYSIIGFNRLFYQTAKKRTK